MDPTAHISPIDLFYYLNEAEPLTDDQREHLKHCPECQDLLEQFETYIDHSMIPAA
jgi:hypothetical protein